MGRFSGHRRALDAAAMTVANAPDPEEMGTQVRRALHGVVNGMLARRA